MKKIFSIFCGVLMVFGLMFITPSTVVAEDTSIDFATFMEDLLDDGYFNGNGGTVKWGPSEYPEEIKRVQLPNAQYQISFANKDTNVVIENTNFEYVPGTIIGHVDGWDGTGTWTADDVRNAEFQFLNAHSVTIENCHFVKVIVSPYGYNSDPNSSIHDNDSTRTFTVKNCSFSDVYNQYALKDIYPYSATITGNTFSNCSGAIYFEGSVERGLINISDNTFDNIDQNAAEGKANTRGVIQLSEKFSFGDETVLNMSGNIITSNEVRKDDNSANALPVIRLITKKGSVSLQGWTPGEPISVLVNTVGAQLPTISTEPQEYNGSTYTFLGWVGDEDYTGATSDYATEALLENGYSQTLENKYYYGVWKVETPEQPEPSEPTTTPTPTATPETSDSSHSSCAANDKNCDGVVTCDEVNGAGWVWSEDQKMCVLVVETQPTTTPTSLYQIVNTSDR